MKICGMVFLLFIRGILSAFDTSAPIAIVIDADQGKVLFEKNARMPCFPASTTKIATALYTLYQKGEDLDDMVFASKDALQTVPTTVRRNQGPSYRLEPGGTHIGLQVGEVLSLRTLLHGLMLASGNDAANVLAEYVSGSVERFMEELNLFLYHIGCEDTHFTNPHGLPDHQHQTTAFDLAKMAQIAMRIPVFRKIVSTTQYEREATHRQPSSMFVQTNALLRASTKHFYPDATGVKTGYTSQAGYNIVASASRNGRNLIAVVCQCEESAKRFRAVQQLLDMLLDEPKQTRKLFSREHELYHHELSGAKTALDSILQEDVLVSFYPSEKKSFTSQMSWRELTLPIYPGMPVGSLQILDEQLNLVTEVMLLAKNLVEPTWSYRIEMQTKQIVNACMAYRKELGYLLALGCLMVPCWKRVRRQYG